MPELLQGGYEGCYCIKILTRYTYIRLHLPRLSVTQGTLFTCMPQIREIDRYMLVTSCRTYIHVIIDIFSRVSIRPHSMNVFNLTINGSAT